MINTRVYLRASTDDDDDDDDTFMDALVTRGGLALQTGPG